MVGRTGFESSSLCFVKSGDAFLIEKQNKEGLNEVLYVVGRTGLEPVTLAL